MKSKIRKGPQGIAEAGFSLLEITVVVVVISLLIGISIPSYNAFKRQAEKARCIGNLKTLHTGFDSFLLEKHVWPQVPAETFDQDESKYFTFWITVLEPYGVGTESWICSGDRVLKMFPERKDEYVSSYVPTPFNSHQHTPYRWNQPWVTERGDYHGKGAHVLMPDGSITTSTNPYGGK